MGYTRDQLRAQRAYRCVKEAMGKLSEKDQEEYKIAVNHFGDNVMKNGLALALAFLGRQMDKRAANSLVLEHLASVEIAGLDLTTGQDVKIQEQLIQRVAQMETGNYMLATRTYLRQIIWFRRAVQALLPTENKKVKTDSGEA